MYKNRGRRYTPDYCKLDRIKVDKKELARFLDVPELDGLNANEKGRIEYLLESPGKDEFPFFRKLIGKTPAQVRTMMIKEFTLRFDKWNYRSVLEWFPSRRSWRGLDIAITECFKWVASFQFAYNVDEPLLYWEKMRYLLEALPQKKDYCDKYIDNTDSTARPKRGWHYTQCRFCWRTVPYNHASPKKSNNLCFVHNISATNPIYRRHKRLLPRLMAERRLVVPRLQELFPRSMSDQEARKTLLNALSVPNDYLPHLVDYLGKVGHDGEPESLLWAFHGPSCDMNESYKEAMNEYIQDILTSENLFEPGQPVPFILTPIELSYAEAWLTLLESDGRFKNGLNAAP